MRVSTRGALPAHADQQPALHMGDRLCIPRSSLLQIAPDYCMEQLVAEHRFMQRMFPARCPPAAGDPHRAIDVEDYWVFERPILKAWIVPRPGPQDAAWRLVERLSYNK